jgi:hypothetical protein
MCSLDHILEGVRSIRAGPVPLSHVLTPVKFIRHTAASLKRNVPEVQLLLSVNYDIEVFMFSRVSGLIEDKL